MDLKKFPGEKKGIDSARGKNRGRAKSPKRLCLCGFAGFRAERRGISRVNGISIFLTFSKIAFYNF